MTTPADTTNSARLYIVARRDNSIEHVVRANGRTIAHGCAVALSHIAAGEYDVHHATVEDLVRLLPTHPVENAASSV